jgi:hypothetical protein
VPKDVDIPGILIICSGELFIIATYSAPTRVFSVSYKGLLLFSCCFCGTVLHIRKSCKRTGVKVPLVLKFSLLQVEYDKRGQIQ